MCSRLFVARRGQSQRLPRFNRRGTVNDSFQRGPYVFVLRPFDLDLDNLNFLTAEGLRQTPRSEFAIGEIEEDANQTSPVFDSGLIFILFFALHREMNKIKIFV